MSSSRVYRKQDVELLAPRAALPWTVCVLFYGAHADLCRRFLDSLYRWTDPACFHLRAGMNAVCRETETLLRRAAAEHGNIMLYPSARNIYKCPMMRRMFHCPAIATEWTVWFDDDSHVTGPHWLLDLALKMECHPQAELFGSLHHVEASAKLERFITSARWYRGLPRRRDERRGVPVCVFPAGGFWAVKSAHIAATDWPDRRLQHFEDDYFMGEAMRQNGVKMAHFESGVMISDAPRRAPADAPDVLMLDHSDAEESRSTPGTGVAGEGDVQSSP